MIRTGTRYRKLGGHGENGRNGPPTRTYLVLTCVDVRLSVAGLSRFDPQRDSIAAAIAMIGELFGIGSDEH